MLPASLESIHQAITTLMLALNVLPDNINLQMLLRVQIVLFALVVVLERNKQHNVLVQLTIALVRSAMVDNINQVILLQVSHVPCIPRVMLVPKSL